MTQICWLDKEKFPFDIARPNLSFLKRSRIVRWDFRHALPEKMQAFNSVLFKLQGSMVIEYIGSIIRNEVANRREQIYEKQVCI